MRERYAVFYDGPRTVITECPDGEHLRWQHARAAAIEHIEEMVAGAEEALWVLGRSASFSEYLCLRDGTTPKSENCDGGFMSGAHFRD